MISIKKKFIIFNLFKSTGFLVPVLYLYIQNKIGLSLEQIIQIAGFYMLLPFLLEVPLGYLGDKIGNKRILQIGLITQILSCLFLLLNIGELSYHGYLITIYFAGAAYSGADKALIHPYFNNQTEFKTFLVKLNGDFYKYSIVFLIIGALSYELDPRLPVIMQIIAFIISFIGVSGIKEKKIGSNNKKSDIKNDFGIIGKFLLKNFQYLLLTLITQLSQTLFYVLKKKCKNPPKIARGAFWEPDFCS